MFTTLCLPLLFLAHQAAPTPTKPSPFARWESAIAAIEKRDKKNPPPDGAVIFCGSSSIVRWKLDQSFPDRKVVNHGFGGSMVADSTHFAPRLIHPFRPSAIVFYAGDNDLARGRTPEQVADDFRGFVRVVRGKLPDVPIFFLAVKPSPQRWRLVEQGRKANDLVKADCGKGKALMFIDVATPLLGADGMPRKELYASDGLHLSPEGYAVWTKVVSSQLRSLGQ